MSDDERVPEVTPNELVYSLNVMKLGMASGRAVTLIDVLKDTGVEVHSRLDNSFLQGINQERLTES